MKKKKGKCLQYVSIAVINNIRDRFATRLIFHGNIDSSCYFVPNSYVGLNGNFPSEDSECSKIT